MTSWGESSVDEYPTDPMRLSAQLWKDEHLWKQPCSTVPTPKSRQPQFRSKIKGLEGKKSKIHDFLLSGMLQFLLLYCRLVTDFTAALHYNLESAAASGNARVISLLASNTVQYDTAAKKFTLASTTAVLRFA